MGKLCHRLYLLLWVLPCSPSLQVPGTSEGRHPLFSFLMAPGPSLIVFMAPSGFSTGVKVKQVIIFDLSHQISTSASNSDTRSESHCSPSQDAAHRWRRGPPYAAVPLPPGHLCVVRLCTYSAKPLLLFLGRFVSNLF